MVNSKTIGCVSSRVTEHNKRAWDAMAEARHEWTLPASADEICAARNGVWTLYLGDLAIPRSWFPPLRGASVLCIAAGGGNYGPILAAAGANVTIVDNSPKQLQQDATVARRDNLSLKLIEGDAQELQGLPGQSFNLVILPVAPFIPNILAVWSEVARVTNTGGTFLAGMKNPAFYVFGRHDSHTADLRARYAIPYSDTESISDAERVRLYGTAAPLEFGHSLRDLIGGQTDHGFAIVGLLEASRPDQPIAKFIDEYVCTRAVRLPRNAAEQRPR